MFFLACVLLSDWLPSNHFSAEQNVWNTSDWISQIIFYVWFSFNQHQDNKVLDSFTCKNISVLILNSDYLLLFCMSPCVGSSWNAFKVYTKWSTLISMSQFHLGMGILVGIPAWISRLHGVMVRKKHGRESSGKSSANSENSWQVIYLVSFWIHVINRCWRWWWYMRCRKSVVSWT